MLERGQGLDQERAQMGAFVGVVRDCFFFVFRPVPFSCKTFIIYCCFIRSLLPKHFYTGASGCACTTRLNPSLSSLGPGSETAGNGGGRMLVIEAG